MAADWLSTPWQFVSDESGATYAVSPDGGKIPIDQWTAINQQKMQEKNVADMKAQGLNPDGSPIRPEYQSQLDASGLLKDVYQVKPELIDPNALSGFQAIKQLALRQGPSAWANLMTQKQAAEEAAAKDAAARQALAGQAQSRAALGMQGGLSSGARERLAMGGNRGLMEARQGVAQQGIGNRLNIGIQDEQQRQALLPQFANAEGGLMQSNLASKNAAQKYNIEAALKEIQAKRDQEMGVYSENVKKYGSQKEAEATANANKGGGGSWLCTKVHEVVPFTKHEKKLLMQFKRYTLKTHPVVGKFYFLDGFELISRMEEVSWKDFALFAQTIIGLLEQKEFEQAYNLYRTEIIHLIRLYWPKCDAYGYLTALDEERTHLNTFMRGA